MAEQKQKVLLDGEKEEQELEDAETAFRAGDKVVDLEKPSKEETAKRYQDILISLGFAFYDNKEKGISCKLKAGSLQIGRTFTDKHPIGNMWVKCVNDCDFGKKGEFLKTDQCKQIPQVALFYRIRDGELAIPEPTVTGKVVGKSERAVELQFVEFGKTDTQWWGLGALKKNQEGITYVPSSYSKETEKYTPKMQVPRDIVLLNYDDELTAAPLVTQTGTSEKKEEQKEEEKAQSAAKGTMADMVTPKEPAHAESETGGGTVKELISKYVDILAQTTEAVAAEGRIPDREKGYAVKFVYYSVVGETRKTELSETTIEAIAKAILNAELQPTEKGGDQGEQD